MTNQPYHLVSKILDVVSLTKATTLIDLESRDEFIAKAITYYLHKVVTPLTFKQALTQNQESKDCVLLIGTLESIGKRDGKLLLKQLLKQHHALLISFSKGTWDAGDIAALGNAFILHDADQILIYVTHSEKAILHLRKARIKHKLLRTIERSQTVKKLLRQVTRKTKSS